MERLARDLKIEFPDITGFSLRNLHYMRKFAESYPDINYATAVAQIPWGHNILLLEKVDNQAKRLWYVQQTIEGGWSRRELENWIESDLYGRKGKAITNFKQTLPTTQSKIKREELICTSLNPTETSYHAPAAFPHSSSFGWEELMLILIPLYP
ncbi:MAG: hypothetical protein HW387_462 [Parachlamydiales bacterium]|nr:hypothetical protein [Parachlamydiales bacterium]